MSSIEPWWGSFRLGPAPGARFWQIGPLALAIGRRLYEWRVAWETGTDPLDPRLTVAIPDDHGLLDEGAERPGHALHRFAVEGTDTVVLHPMLADRPVVVRPEVPFHLPGGREALVYVSTPVWVRVEIGGLDLLEIPSLRLRDTWFGPSTRVGELCYASRTNARLRAELQPRLATRASTQVRILNRGQVPLTLERLKVPVPSLALYGGEAHGLLTQRLTVIRTAGGATEVELGAPPRDLLTGREAPLLAPARKAESLNALARALGAFVG